MKKFLITFAFILLNTVAMAIPAKRGIWKTITLPDGTEVRAQLCGDEHVHFWQTEDGQRLVREGDGYAIITAEQVAARAARRRAPMASRMAKAPRRVAMGDRTHYQGKKKGLVILAQYKDVKFQDANDLPKYKCILNDTGYTTVEGFRGCVADYFKAQSRGQFELEFDVVGPYTLKYNRSYYGTNDSQGNDKNAEGMIVEACKAADSVVDFSNYDWDGDGYVDQVFVLYAGTGEADSDDEESIWPHMYELSYTDQQLTLDGVTIDTYACSNEVDMYDNIEGIGCFCHEFSHCMGFPDFYDTSYSGWFGLSQFDLMDQGSYNGNGFTPAGYSAHEKMMCGWQEPIELAEGSVDIDSLAPLSEGGESYIIYNKAHPNEYYMLENRQKKGWDAQLPAKGLMITHVDFDKTIWEDNTPNTKVTSTDMRTYGYRKLNDHQRCTIFHADNNDDAQYWNSREGYYTRTTLTNDLYPYLKRDSLTNTSKPAASLYNANTDGSKLMNVKILNIKQNSNGTVSFRFEGPKTDDGSGVEPLAAEDQQADQRVYDLSGRYVRKPARGLYIVGKKKVIIR